METMESSDASLVTESLTGNREAFGHIVARYQTLICSLAYSGTGSLSQSEDVAQETFVAAWKQLGDLRVLPFGAIALGLLVLGGLGLGVWTFGVLAVGWQAVGCCAVAWNVAVGGVAQAHDFALGGIAHAAQANNAIAREFIAPNLFFHYSQIIVRYCVWLNLLWVVPVVVQWRVIARKRLHPERNNG